MPLDHRAIFCPALHQPPTSHDGPTEEPPAAEPLSRWQLAVCSGSAVFLAAVLALHPGARFQGRSVAQLLRGLTSRPEPVPSI
jgi:hypothetical protein